MRQEEHRHSPKTQQIIQLYYIFVASRRDPEGEDEKIDLSHLLLQVLHLNYAFVTFSKRRMDSLLFSSSVENDVLGLDILLALIDTEEAANDDALKDNIE